MQNSSPHPLTLVLASASPARKKLLINAGISPHVMVSDVDEDAVLKHAASLSAFPLRAVHKVQILAQAKADNIIERLCEQGCSDDESSAESHDAHLTRTLLVACDSLFELDGVVYGKPKNSDIAFERIARMRNNSGILYTGHYIFDFDAQRGRSIVSSTRVHFGSMTDADIRDYVATGEPLNVAGSFTIDGLGAPFVERIEGDYSTVVGLSLPVLRNTVTIFGYSWSDLWHTTQK